MSFMKYFLLPVLIVAFATSSSAQNEKFAKAMEALVPAVDTTRSPEGLNELANSFERIANAEKTQWLPFYYAALCHINIANLYFQQQKTDQIDIVMDKAEPLVNAAAALQKDNSEIMLLKKMFNTGKMMADPMNRYMTFGMDAQASLETAKSLDARNPRVYLMEGIDKYFTPEQFGGSKVEGRKLFEEADRLFGEFRPASSIHPDWGRPMVKYFLAETSK
jgi:hypothetical protein